MLQHKFAPIEEIDVDDKGWVSGYASKFNEIDQGGDQIKAGAYTETLQKRTPKMLWQHNPDWPIGSWRTAKEDKTGLLVNGRLTLGSQKGRDTYELIKDGVIDGLSIGYRVEKASDHGKIRVIEKIDLWEISLVTFPMQETATLTSVKHLSDREAEEMAERVLMDAGFSAEEAKAARAAVANWRNPVTKSDVLAALRSRA